MVKTTHFQITNFHITSIKKLQSPGIYKFLHTWEWKKKSNQTKRPTLYQKTYFCCQNIFSYSGYDIHFSDVIN